MKYTERKRVRGVQVVKVKSRFSSHLVRGVIGIVILGILLSGIHYFTRLPAFTIQDVTVSGGETISHEEIRTRAFDALKGSYFFLIPKSFTLLYPYEYMRTRVDEVARVHDVHIEKVSPTALHITFKEYIPHALLCQSGETNAPCFFIDETGFAFAEAPQLTGGALVRHNMVLYDGHTLDMGIDAGTLNTTQRFIERTERELGLRIIEVLHKENADLEFSISGGGAIYATRAKDLDAQFSHLQSLLASKEFSHIESDNFKYIDIRFDTKIFVNEELSTTTATSSMLSE